MTAKQWLARRRPLQAEIEELQETAGGNSDDGEYLRIINQKICKNQNEINKILKTIMKMPNTNERTVLIAKYINGKTLETIAEEQGYSLRWAQVLLKSGEKNILYWIERR